MFTIYHKTKQEIKMEEEIQKIYPTKNPKIICPTYIRKNNGLRLNTYDLTEEEIISLIDSDFLDWLNPKGNYARFRIGPMKSTYDLAQCMHPKFNPSYNMILALMEMQEKYPVKVVEDIMLKFKCGEKLNQAIMIASYLKETNEDFSDITRQEILEVLMQLVENQTKKTKSKTKKKI